MRLSFSNSLVRVTLAVAGIVLLTASGQARVTRLVVEHTESLGHDGYQKLTGHVYGELDPKLPLNAIITDLEFAPRNARGMVEYAATFTIIKPADMSKASGVLLYFVPNRGRINLIDGGFLADARKLGHVIVASGWQGDLAPADGVETMAVPVARISPGTSITGAVLARFSDVAAGQHDPAHSARRRRRYGRPGQPRYCQSHVDPPSFRRWPDRPSAQRGLGLRRLQQDRLPRHAGSPKDLH